MTDALSPSHHRSARDGRCPGLPKRQIRPRLRLDHDLDRRARRLQNGPRPAPRHPQPVLRLRRQRQSRQNSQQGLPLVRGPDMDIRRIIRLHPALRKLAALLARRETRRHCRHQLPELAALHLSVVGALESRRKARLHQLQPRGQVALALRQGRQHDSLRRRPRASSQHHGRSPGRRP